jgi:transcriptional regulator with XRE-family HTH domain
MAHEVSSADADQDEYEEGRDPYSRHVGRRLRAIRKQKGLSLQDVERTSKHEFKASVLGAYERGERAISVPRLGRLARIYSVPVEQLLPRREDAELETATGLVPDEAVKIDLTRLDHLPGPEAAMLNRYLTMIQVQRQDFNGRVLTIRRDDLRAIACILGTGLDQTPDRLDAMGLSLNRL